MTLISKDQRQSARRENPNDLTGGADPHISNQEVPDGIKNLQCSVCSQYTIVDDDAIKTEDVVCKNYSGQKDYTMTQIAAVQIGSKGWAVLQTMAGKEVQCGDERIFHVPEDVIDAEQAEGWGLVKGPVFGQGQLVRWYRGPCNGTGSFLSFIRGEGIRFPWKVSIDGIHLNVEWIEKL